MKYVYLAIAAACLYLMLNSRTDPFEIKAGINTILPGDTLQASSGHTINARLLPELSSYQNKKIPRKEPEHPFAELELLCNTHPVECHMVTQHLNSVQ